MSCNLINLFLALLERHIGVSQHAICKGRRVTFIHETDWQVRDMVEPKGEFSSFPRLLTLSPVAVDRQTDHPAQDLVFLGDSLKVFFIKGWIASRVGFQRACPRPARVAKSDTDANGSVIDARQSTRIWPVKVSSVGVPQIAQPSRITLM